ncbi:hypothetical protein V4E72_005098 [Escherichia coli]|nr:hypothetical protein [Escherichia coli]
MNIDMNKFEEMLKKQGMRLGTEISISLKNGDNFAPTGCIVTKVDKENRLIYCRPIQKEIDGTWYNIEL